MRRDLELEAELVEKWVAIEPYLDESGRRRWAAAEARALGYGGDSVVSSATGLSRVTAVESAALGPVARDWKTCNGD